MLLTPLTAQCHHHRFKHSQVVSGNFSLYYSQGALLNTRFTQKMSQAVYKSCVKLSLKASYYQLFITVIIQNIMMLNALFLKYKCCFLHFLQCQLYHEIYPLELYSPLVSLH